MQKYEFFLIRQIIIALLQQLTENVASFRDAGILLLIITALRNKRCCSLSVATPPENDVAPFRSRHRTLLVRCYSYLTPSG